MDCPSCQATNDQAAEACTTCGASLGGLTDEVVVTVDLRPGTLFDSRYEILGRLGRGGMGMVYKAHDRDLDEVVAIKVLRPDFAQDPRMADRFRTEIKLARKVRHRNVCTIHHYGQCRGLLYISMELIGGVDLKKMLRDSGPLPTAQAFDTAIQIAEGLEAVHEAGIIHRDLKTPNIMIDEQGMARLMDFGIAKRHGDGTMTTTGNVIGTPEYMSPEQAQGGKVDYRSDLYALGIVTYEIFTGRVPFHGETPISTILKHLHDPPPLEGEAAESIPVPLRRVLRCALAKEAGQRYASARDMAEALRQARNPSSRQQPMATDALVAPTLPSVDVGRRRRPMQAWLLVVPVAAVAGGALWLAQGYSRQKAGPLVASAPSTVAPSTAPVSMAVPLSTAAAATVVPTPDASAASAPTIRPSSSPASLHPRPTPVPSNDRIGRLPSPRPPTPAPREVVTAPSPSLVPAPAATARPEPPAEAGKGLLQIAVIPWGEVVLDGRSLGTTPIDRVTVSVGPHTLKVRHPLYEVQERQVIVRAGEVEKVVINFATEGVRKPR